MSYQGPSAPVREPMTDANRTITVRWGTWLRDLRQQVDAAAAQTIAPVSRTGQTASIGTTPLETGSLAPGLYRLTYSVQVTTAAGVSSSIQVTFGWTRNGVSQTFTGTAFTGNTTGTNGSQTQLISVDQATPISYATTYASNPALAMVYALDVYLETVSV